GPEAKVAVGGEHRQWQARGFGACRVALVTRPRETALSPSDARPPRREPRRVAFFAVALDIGSRFLRGPLRLVERTAVEVELREQVEHQPTVGARAGRLLERDAFFDKPRAVRGAAELAEGDTGGQERDHPLSAEP